jgi:23S rRNA pseudouridine1911/1915/1917 synthase
MSSTSLGLVILHEDDHLLVCVKPAGIPTANAPRGETSLYTLARRTRPFIGVVSRIDAPVSGVVVFAKTSPAAADLAEQFRHRTVVKEYVAIAEGRFPAPLGEWVEWCDALPADPRVLGLGATGRGGSRPVDRGEDGGDGEEEPGKESVVRARVVRRAGEVSLIELEPSTGRKHQLRIQLATRRCPIVGDRRYGARLPFPLGIALHARRLKIDHPASGEPLCLEAPIPVGWSARFPPLFTGG